MRRDCSKRAIIRNTQDTAISAVDLKQGHILNGRAELRADLPIRVGAAHAATAEGRGDANRERGHESLANRWSNRAQVERCIRDGDLALRALTAHDNAKCCVASRRASMHIDANHCQKVGPSDAHVRVREVDSTAHGISAIVRLEYVCRRELHALADRRARAAKRVKRRRSRAA